MGLWAVQLSLAAAGVGLEAGPVAVAGMEEVEVPAPHSRRHRSSDSGCEVEAVAAEAGGRREGEDRGRSLLARLLTGCPAVAVGEQHRVGPEPGGGAVGVAVGR